MEAEKKSTHDDGSEASTPIIARKVNGFSMQKIRVLVMPILLIINISQGS